MQVATRRGRALLGASKRIRLSATTVSASSAIGTVIGTLSVSGGTKIYSFTLSNDSGGRFSVSGTQLKVAQLLTAGSYSLAVHADDGAGGVIDQTFTVTVTPVGGAFTPSLDFRDARNSMYL